MSQFSTTTNGDERLYFWAIGDLHYRALPAWNEIHTQRLAPMFADLHTLWREEGSPAFCVSPGDHIETCARENYETATRDLAARLGDIPFYPGVGNHEYFGPDGEEPSRMAQTFTELWQKPIRYTWTTNGITCIMLDYPNPHTLEDPTYVYLSHETLTFLDAALTQHAASPTIVFLHCPLRNTVLDRDVTVRRDYASLEKFFSPENSQAMRDILAHHQNAFLCFSGHTHSGWEAPQLVVTEQIGAHPVTFGNLMSPWYTGRKTGIRPSEQNTGAVYVPDNPDVSVTFAVHIYQERAIIRAREHLTRRWLKQWEVPLNASPK